MFLRLAMVDTGASLCLTVPPNWTVFQLKQHLGNGLHGLLAVDATSLQLYAACETLETGRRWIAYSDADAIALLQGHVTDGVQRLMATREMSDARRLCDFGFDEQLDAVHVVARCHTLSSREVERAWMTRVQAWRAWLPYACLFFTVTLFVTWLDTIVTWLQHCDSNWELVRNLPWVVLSTTLFVASVYVYAKDIAVTQAREGYIEIA